MNIRIKINESTNKTIRATIYTGNGASTNVGTLWMTREEFEDFSSILTFGIPENSELIIDSPEESGSYPED
tara:strand:+ start:548 stop:760 length:213 start_codon:yes stop_codon:yes gene_type:complete